MTYQSTFLCCSPDVHYSFFKWKSFHDIKKSWFFIGEEFVCVGSDITSATGDPIETTILNHRLLQNVDVTSATGDQPIETTILNHRLLQNVECFVSFDNKKISCKELKDDVKCLILTGNNWNKSGISIFI